MAKRIVFRADASHAVGFGHVARLCALMEETTAAGAEALALFGGDVPMIQSWARDRKIEVDAQGMWSEDQVVRVAEESHAHAVVIDRPYSGELVARLAERKIKTVLLDDNGKLPLSVDAVVNHNIHAPMLAGTYPSAKRRLLGRKYLMLRREFRRFTRGSCRPMSGTRLRVIVTFGGSDPVGGTVRALKLLPSGSERALELVVIAGPGFRDDAALAEAAAEAEENGHTVDIRRSPDDPGALFVSADAAICSAGGTLGELAYLGVPACAYAIARDQLAPAREQVRAGLIAGGRAWASTDDDTLRADLARFVLDGTDRATMRARALATADGDGARRVLDEAVLS